MTPTTVPSVMDINTHQLTAAERQHILAVLQKQEQLQIVEEEREKDLLDQFSSMMSVLAQSVCERAHSQNTTPTRYSCHVCALNCHGNKYIIGYHGDKAVRSASCWDCNQITCRACGTVQALPTQKRNVWLCKPCNYRRDLISKSGQWYYGKDGLNDNKLINQQVIEALEIAEQLELSRDSEDIHPDWRMKAKKRLSHTGYMTLKVMKQKWQTLAKIKTQMAERQYSFGSSDEESQEISMRREGRRRSVTSFEEIQLYKEYKNSRAAYNRKKHPTTPSTSPMSRKQAMNGSFSSCSRESSPERCLSSQTSSTFSQTSSTFSQSSLSSVTSRTHSHGASYIGVGVDINESPQRNNKSKNKKISSRALRMLKFKHTSWANLSMSTSSLGNVSTSFNTLSAKNMFNSNSAPKL